jgi:hypothetical protein
MVGRSQSILRSSDRCSLSIFEAQWSLAVLVATLKKLIAQANDLAVHRSPGQAAVGFASL